MAELASLSDVDKPDVRNWLDGFGVFFAITLFFCLIQSAHDGILNRNREFDKDRWWFPLYRLVLPPAS